MRRAGGDEIEKVKRKDRDVERTTPGNILPRQIEPMHTPYNPLRTEENEETKSEDDEQYKFWTATAEENDVNSEEKSEEDTETGKSDSKNPEEVQKVKKNTPEEYPFWLK
jgi:hypothetical protein